MRFSSISHFSSLAIISVLTSIVSLATAAQLQYCRVDESLRTDQCLAVSSFHNSTSNSNDFYLLVSAKFENRKGYAAFGTGSTMDGSLMFVIYPGAQDGGMAMFSRSGNKKLTGIDVTLSLRTTKCVDFSYSTKQLLT